MILNDASIGTSKTILPDLPQFEFATTALAMVIPLTDAMSENVFAQLSAPPELIFFGGGLPPVT